MENKKSMVSTQLSNKKKREAKDLESKGETGEQDKKPF